VTSWGLPDWLDPQAYPTERAPREWAWEFLRRDPDYRLDWVEGANRPGRYWLNAIIDPTIGPPAPKRRRDSALVGLAAPLAS
jgi:hypothetical protein